MAGKKQTEIQSPYRKIIQYGTKSHACGITLPAPWLRKNGLNPGDMIRLEEVVDISSENGTGLMLRPIKWSDIGECKIPGQSPANGLKMTLEGKGRDDA